MEKLDLAPYEIVVRPLDTANTNLLVSSELYNIESATTIEARSQSVSTENGNEHTIIKTSNEGIIGTNIAAGELAILDANTANAEQVAVVLARILYF